MSSSRRQALKTILNSVDPGDVTHPGLWYDKYLENQDNKETTYTNLLSGTRQASYIAKKADDSEEYHAYFQRWEKTLKAMGVQTQIAEVTGRVALGLGNASTIENGVTLHKTYGVPFLPGSALKGLARHYAIEHLAEPWSNNGDAFNTLFGTQESAGFVTFFDALPLPRNSKKKNVKEIGAYTSTL